MIRRLLRHFDGYEKGDWQIGHRPDGRPLAYRFGYRVRWDVWLRIRFSRWLHALPWRLAMRFPRSRYAGWWFRRYYLAAGRAMADGFAAGLTTGVDPMAVATERLQRVAFGQDDDADV